MKNKYYDPFSNKEPKVQSFDPSEKILRGTEGPLSIEKLSLFFKDSFLPNHDEFCIPSTFEDLITIHPTKNGYITTMENLCPSGSKDKLNILDLACGDTPFLRKLLSQHGGNKCPTGNCKLFEKAVAKKVRYVAVDLEFHQGYRDSFKSWLSDFDQCFEFIPQSLDLRRPLDLEILSILKGDTPFDMVILSNALHEISPEFWSALLSIIPDLMHDEGTFLFLDPSNPMDLQDHSNVFASVRKATSYWESEAIYCLWSDAMELANQIGMDVKPSFDHDRVRPYWYMKIKKKAEMLPREERKEMISSYLSSIAKRQLEDWKGRSKDERKKVIDVFKKTNASHKEERILSALRYLCLCASDSRLRECLQSIGLMESIENLLGEEYGNK